MRVIELQQGSNAWHQHRARHWNASDTPAVLGVSPYKTRADLIRERATGVAADVDEATQRRFNDGHRFEELARPLAEKIIGDELYPCVGVADDGKFAASFDGLTMAEDCAFEHKTLNDTIRAAIESGTGNGVCLPEYLRAQMEHQLMVSGAERVLFMASKWNGDTLAEERHCWYYPDAELRARIVAAWAQFEADVAAYVPEETKPAPVAAVVEGFGALSLRIEGRVLASNLDAFKAGAEAFIARLPKPDDLQTDQDFADAESAVKACEEAETRIKAAKDAAQAQMADVDAAFRLADTVAQTIRAARLALDKVVKVEKENRRGQIVQAGVDAVAAHYTLLNKSLGEYTLSPPASLRSDMGAAIKGKRTIASLKDAIDSAVATAKIEASQTAERVRQNIAVLTEEAYENDTLFPDRRQLVASKAPDDLRNLVRARIAEQQQREQARLDAERERIRQEEADRIERERAQQESKPEPPPPPPPPPPTTIVRDGVPVPPAPPPPPPERLIRNEVPVMPAGETCTIGQINEWIAPLSINADGLASLGFRPSAKRGAAKLYPAEDFPHICGALARLIAEAPARAAQKRAA